MTSLTFVAIALAAVGSQPKLLDFYSEHCGPCRQMAPAIAELERRGHAVEKIDVDRQPQMAAQYRVDSIPCLVVVVDGREVDRSLGVTPVEQLETMLRTAGTSSAAAAQSTPAPVAAAPAMRGAAPRDPHRGAVAGVATGRPARTPSTRGRQPLASTGAPRLLPTDQVQPQAEPNEALEAMSPAPQANDAPQMAGIESEQPLRSDVAGSDFASVPTPVAATSEWKASAADGGQGGAVPPAAARGQHASPDRLLAASVRLRIEEAGGHSTGSGTIVDVRGEDALVLTCGHVFRDSQGKGNVTVDMFGPGAPQGLVGEVISFDLETDVGLVSFRPGLPVTVARVPPPGHRLQPGDPVFSTGCNNGEEPSLRSSRITTVDKYLGPPNLQVAGQPVQGRSGGGLFNAQGEVIGVCNAADPADNEGLYAALPSIYKLLDTAGLAAVYRPGGTMIASAGQPSPAAIDPRPPHMPERMPLAVNPASATETSAPQESLAGPAPLSPAEQAALSAMQSEGKTAEVVCVIRSHDNPQSRSEVILLDRASPEFLRQLAIERQRQHGGQLMPDRGAIGAVARPGNVLEARRIDSRSAAMR